MKEHRTQIGRLIAMQISNRRTGQQDKPLVIGVDNGDPARLVQTTGLAHGILKGKQRWVTGDGVQASIDNGMFIEIGVGEPAQYAEGATGDADSTTGDAAGSPDAPETMTDEELQAEADLQAAEVLLATAHAAYDDGAVADLSIPKTVEWIGEDLVRAEVVEARESAKGDGARKGVMEHVTAMLDGAEADENA